MKKKERLDKKVQEIYPHLSRNQIQSLIMQNKVFVDDKPINKAGIQIAPDSVVRVEQDTPDYVCRAGYKLAKALDYFSINPQGLTVLDAGLSTGGFTDCLLQRGAKKVYGVDVGYGQVHEKIRNDPRVQVMERTNVRYVTDVGEQVDAVTLDLSFISVLKVMDAVCAVLRPQGLLIVLIKPQFEAQKEQVGKKGIIKDSTIHQEVVQKVSQGIQERGFILQGITESPIQGATGNTEFLGYFIKK